MYNFKNMTFEMERVVPSKIKWFQKQVYYDHLERYIFAEKYIKNKVILDIACGAGYGCLELTKFNPKTIIGIDNSSKTIQYAKKWYSHKKITYIQGKAEKIPLKNNSVDIVTSFETIEHLKNPHAFINEVKRVLKKGGICIISTPNKDFSFYPNPFHLNEFTLQELTQMCSNLKLVDSYGQRKVNNMIYVLYKKFGNILPPPINYLLQYRPWENSKIKKLNKNQQYQYFVLVYTKH